MTKAIILGAIAVLAVMFLFVLGACWVAGNYDEWAAKRRRRP